MTDHKASSSVHIQNVKKSFGAHTALHQTSLDIEQGTFMTLLGPSGCGKSTLLNIISGFISPTEGKIYLGSNDVTDVPPYQRRVGMVFQNYALFPHMTVAENLAYGLKMQRVARNEIASEVNRILDAIKLNGYNDRYPRQLSGGQQQRIAIGRAVIINPHVLLLDEPLSALDKNLRANMQVEIKSIQARLGITTVFVTHDQDEALSLSDRLAVMSEGRIRQTGTPSEIYDEPKDAFVASFLGDITQLEAEFIGQSGNEVKLEIQQGSFTLPVSKCPNGTKGALYDVFVRPEHFSIAPTLEEAPIVGEVAVHVYQGSHVDMYVKNSSANEGVILLRLADVSAPSSYPVGSKIGISYDASKVLVFPKSHKS